MSSLLRYDLSRQDLVKWVDFARRTLAIILVSIVTMAGLSAILSTKQAEGLLKESLSAQGRAIADALGRAAFVPLTLEDQKTLAGLLDSYNHVDNVASVRIRDGQGRILHEVVRGAAGSGAVTIRAPIVALSDIEETQRPRNPIGLVEVDMWSQRIEAKSRTIAWVNVLISSTLAIAISVIGFFMIRNLVTRMHELVGEARLIEEIKHVNAELESFSYSVSHDLRAPLRSIAGFSQMLLEDSAPRLDEAGKENLRRVVAATKRMGNLIDDILDLSRLTRKEIQRTKVGLSELAKSIVKEMRERDPARRLEVRIADGLVTDGDAQLLRAMLENLLGNAWKYTSKKSDAWMEFGAARDPKGKNIFFVKDNGAGFDMAYKEKLFSPFQRLHSASEFEGTGVGLATVQRIIRRHGGKIWAESAVDQGASFYFTLE